MGIFQTVKDKLKRKNVANSEQGHRLIYYGDVPTVESVEELSGGEAGASAAASGSANGAGASDTAPGGSGGQSPEDQRAHGTVTLTTLRSRHLRPTENTPFSRKRNQEYTSNVIRTSRYTVLNFVPKNLFEQFRRAANFYFLCMAVIQSVIESPVHPFTAAVPLIFVIFTTAVKQGYEDWLRHKADANVNNRPVCVVRDGNLVVIKAKDVSVGDVLRLEGEDQVPADILLVGSSDEFLRCQITTANLDGETNLKMRYCPAGLLHFKHEKDFAKLHVILECEQPNPSLYEFNGCLLVPPGRMPTSRMSESTTSPISTSTTGDSNDPSRRSKTPGLSLTPSTMPRSRDGSISNFFTVPLSMENMVLRGARIKNTEFIFGLVVYTGRDTRLAQNSKQSTLKHSTVEKTENHFLYVFIATLLVMVAFSSAFHYYNELDWVPIKNSSYILGADKDGKVKSKEDFMGPTDWLKDVRDVVLSFLILFNYIIPISLYVTVELQKFFGSKFFVFDLEMTDPVSGHQPLCNTSDLNEELGQVEYLFTDKTGTLTENIMQFRHCSVGTKSYDYVDDSLFERDTTGVSKSQLDTKPVDIAEVEEVGEFLKILALCHSVQLMPIRRASFETTTNPSRVSNFVPGGGKMKGALNVDDTADARQSQPSALGILGKWEYQASSPDEKALLESCYRLDVKYLGEREDMMTLDVVGKTETYRRHFILEFDPDRKCMSVIVENHKGEIWLYSKGAESTILPRCDYGPTEETLKAVVDFAMLGMRTLAVAKRQLTKDELHRFSHKLKAARRLLKGRDEAMRELYRSVESHLTCIGATGVEDQLQQGVPEMLQALNAAGIRIWMLTGDKIETGVSVGVACGLITPATKQYFLTHGIDQMEVTRQLEDIKKEIKPDDNTTLILDGASLEIAFTHCPELFASVALGVYRVVCCRMAPLQKAQIVNMVKTSAKKPITAAVGDGANDVAMIQEAHIGIGILGKEGRQAARSADFALARSSFLKKAILVHGHWYYVRLAVLVMYFFYKNIVFIGPQFIYCFFSTFSTQSLYDSWSLMFYNIFYTSCPIFTYGVQEQPYSSKTLMHHPMLYQTITRNALLAWKEFFRWSAFAIWHSLVCFFVPFFSWSFFTPITDWSSFGTLCFCCVVAVVNMKLATEYTFVSFWTVFSQIFSYGSMLILCSIYSESNLDLLVHEKILPPGEYRHVYFTMLSTLQFWLTVIGATMVALIPDLMYKVYVNSEFRFSKVFCIIKNGIPLRRPSSSHPPFKQVDLNGVKKAELLHRVSLTLEHYTNRDSIEDGRRWSGSGSEPEDGTSMAEKASTPHGPIFAIYTTLITAGCVNRNTPVLFV